MGGEYPDCMLDDWLEHNYLGAHNAYHQRQTGVHTTTIQNQSLNVSIPVNQYDYPSITELLDNGVCNLEIDIYPKENTTESNYGEDFMVKHYDYFDDESTCKTLPDCLKEVSDWLYVNDNNKI